MARSQQTFNKKEREKKKRKRKQDKREKREERKHEKAEYGKKSFEEQLAYVDENGNLTDTPPDPLKKRVIKVEDIKLGVPQVSHEPMDSKRNGIVKFFNSEKGFGFITDDQTKESIFVHINNATEELKENHKVSFETEKGPKGLVAVNVIVVK